MISRMFEIFGLCVGGAFEVVFIIALGFIIFMFIPQILALLLPIVGIVIFVTVIGYALQILWRIFF
ncbi:MAG: hypothetical protein AB2L14_21710 [Candidatus Xenobiia bacterium LiM19]